MLSELTEREISLKLRLYENELRRSVLEKDFSEAERNTTARETARDFEAQRLDLTARLWLYEYGGEAIRSDDPEKVRRHLEPLYSKSKTEAQALSSSDEVSNILEVIHAGRVAREARHALRILRDFYHVETVDLPEEGDPHE